MFFFGVGGAIVDHWGHGFLVQGVYKQEYIYIYIACLQSTQD